MYCVSLIDRTNLSMARQANELHMDRELGTKYGQRYSIITILFFPTYIVLELPVSLTMPTMPACAAYVVHLVLRIFTPGKFHN